MTKRHQLMTVVGCGCILALYLFLALSIWHSWVGAVLGVAGGLLVASIAYRRERRSRIGRLS